jgi:hypothetical protein
MKYEYDSGKFWSVKTPAKDGVGNVEKLSFIIIGRILEMSSLKDLNYKDYSIYIIQYEGLCVKCTVTVDCAGENRGIFGR